MSTTLPTWEVYAIKSKPAPQVTRQQTRLAMNPLPDCSNAKSKGSGRAACVANFFHGDYIKFTGKLTTADGNGVSGKVVKIFTRPPPGIEFNLLASNATDNDGRYEIVWKVKLPTLKQTYQETVKKRLSQPLLIFAMFEGDDKLSYAKSNMQAISIKVKDLLTIIRCDRAQHYVGDIAVVSVNFVEGFIYDGKIVYGESIDPDVINAKFDQKSVMLEKKKVGLYIFITPSMTGEVNHQLDIWPQKEGFNSYGAFHTMVLEDLRENK
jgi:hypothetical protein